MQVSFYFDDSDIPVIVFASEVDCSTFFNDLVEGRLSRPPIIGLVSLERRLDAGGEIRPLAVEYLRGIGAGCAGDKPHKDLVGMLLTRCLELEALRHSVI